METLEVRVLLTDPYDCFRSDLVPDPGNYCIERIEYYAERDVWHHIGIYRDSSGGITYGAFSCHSADQIPGVRYENCGLVPDTDPPPAMPDIAMLSAELGSATTVQFKYRVTGRPGSFEVGVFRSANDTFDQSDEQIGELQTITPGIGDSTQMAKIRLAMEIPIDPSRKYVLVVADPKQLILESNEGNNDDAYFRKLALGVVTHGFTPPFSNTDWVDLAADALQKQGYSQTIPFRWEDMSRRPAPNQTVTAGRNLAEEVKRVADEMATQPSDVVDVHFIGHSRGAVVISQALKSLQTDLRQRELRLGYFKMTMLDPHPARNNGSFVRGILELNGNTGKSRVGWFSYSIFRREPATGLLLFQSKSKDPSILITANVDEAKSYYQTLPWHSTSVFDFLVGFNLWGVERNAISNPKKRPFHSEDISKLGYGHTAITKWYLTNLR